MKFSELNTYRKIMNGKDRIRFNPNTYLVLVFFCLPISLQAQAVHPRLKFMTDSIILGKSIELQMELMHPSHIEVMFPQKRDFEPFDLIKRQALPSREQGNITTEIVSYQMRSFEIAPKQAIRLPYGYVKDNDTLEAFISSDSLPFSARITQLDSTYQFKVHQGIIVLKDPPDYRKIALICLSVLSFLAFLYWLLRKRIEKWVHLYKLRQEWLKIQLQLSSLQENASQQENVLTQLNSIWKGYADPKNQHALKSLTATELRQTLPQLSYISSDNRQFLLELSQKSDQVIYAGKAVSSEEIQGFFEHVKELLKEVYAHQRLTISNSL